MRNFQFRTAEEVKRACEQAAKAARPAKTVSPDGSGQTSKINNLRGEQPTQFAEEHAETEFLNAAYQRTGRIRIESEWAGPVWLVVSIEQVRGDEDGSVYFPNEIPFMVDLSPRDRQLVHGVKQRFGGTIELKPRDDA